VAFALLFTRTMSLNGTTFACVVSPDFELDGTYDKIENYTCNNHNIWINTKHDSLYYIYYDNYTDLSTFVILPCNPQSMDSAFDLSTCTVTDPTMSDCVDPIAFCSAPINITEDFYDCHEWSITDTKMATPNSVITLEITKNAICPNSSYIIPSHNQPDSGDTINATPENSKGFQSGLWLGFGLVISLLVLIGISIYGCSKVEPKLIEKKRALQGHHILSTSENDQELQERNVHDHNHDDDDSINLQYSDSQQNDADNDKQDLMGSKKMKPKVQPIHHASLIEDDDISDSDITL